MTEQPPVYHYFVSFSHSRGFGSAGVPLFSPLETYEAVAEIAREVGRSFGVDDAVVVSFQLLRVEFAGVARQPAETPSRES